ncbi:MAG: hypothetical protein ACJASM_001222 [Salibacteraceae bacterium]
MIKYGYLTSLPRELKWVVALFTITVSVGFYIGIGYVNESDELAEVMRFKKSKHEIFSILHTHFLSLSVIFLIISLLLYGVPMNIRLRKFLILEPLLSVNLTFGGIYFVWLGFEWVSYIVMFSGMLMTVCYSASVVLILFGLTKNNINTSQV